MPRQADELARRLRDLEAERLRPVPEKPTNEAVDSRISALLASLRRDFAHHHDDQEATG